MKPFLIATFLFCTFLSASFTVKPAVADADIEIPFTFEKGHVIVSAKIHGDRPVK